MPQVYWDPSTDKLFVEDIDTAGGKIYLTGKMASTGDGKIMAADGAADISVVNQTSLDMNVGRVLNNQREGVITIVDMADDSWLEFKKGQTREIRGYTNYMRQHGAEDDPYRHATVSSNDLSVNQSITVRPEKNQTYNWANGEIPTRPSPKNCATISLPMQPQEVRCSSVVPISARTCAADKTRPFSPRC